MEFITVEYSPEQKCYHLSTLWDVIRNNAIAARAGINPGFLLIGVFDTDEQANVFGTITERQRRSIRLLGQDHRSRFVHVGKSQ